MGFCLIKPGVDILIYLLPSQQDVPDLRDQMQCGVCGSSCGFAEPLQLELPSKYGRGKKENKPRG